MWVWGADDAGTGANEHQNRGMDFVGHCCGQAFCLYSFLSSRYSGPLGCHPWCLLHPWRTNGSSSSSFPFSHDTNTPRIACCILKSARTHVYTSRTKIDQFLIIFFLFLSIVSIIPFAAFIVWTRFQGNLFAAACDHMSKSIYWWCINGCEARKPLFCSHR